MSTVPTLVAMCLPNSERATTAHRPVGRGGTSSPRVRRQESDNWPSTAAVCQSGKSVPGRSVVYRPDVPEARIVGGVAYPPPQAT